jgi:uncharacterized membrane protein
MAIALSPNHQDIPNYYLVGQTILNGHQLFLDTPGAYPYPPVWAVWEVIAVCLNQWFPFSFVVRLPILSAEVAIILLLNRMAGLRAATLYALSPVAILISSLHGQFDSLPVLCVLLALCYPRHAAWALAVGISLKTWPVLLLPVFILRIENWSNRARFVVIALLPTVLLLLPFFISNFRAVMHEFVGYSGYPDYGLGIIERIIVSNGWLRQADIETLGKVTFVLAYIFICRYLSRNSQVIGCAMVLAAFYAAYPGICAQYLLWLLPVAIVADWRFGVIYNLVGTAALIGGYFLLSITSLSLLPYALHMLWSCTSLVWWYVCARWLVMRLRYSASSKPIVDTSS